jgi:hypothetical protein
MRKLKLETVQVLYQEYTYSGNFKNKGHKELRKLTPILCIISQATLALHGTKTCANKQSPYTNPGDLA